MFDYVYGFMFVSDVLVLYFDYYWLVVCFKCCDGFCLFGLVIVLVVVFVDVDVIGLMVWIDGEVVVFVLIVMLICLVCVLIVDVMVFMLFDVGDVLLFGVVGGVLYVCVGSMIEIVVVGIGMLWYMLMVEGV